MRDAVHGIGRTIQPGLPKASRTQPRGGGKSFAEVLRQQAIESQGVKFSAHAQNRLQARRIALTATDKAKLNSAVNAASEKGSRDALVLFNELAFVVSVKNRTVVTAIDRQELKDRVFTNIDSTVVL